ncbi:hypothetical protein BA766_00355 [Stenotrophomonas maltophilia]|uniref:hypothetical protein n=1 Tax=Stenotrophomonas maltophilia TaxID=40324 RepID=UPI0008108A52|nr:hypothetical protein [Stenotrophomonas maltophilia]OCK48483.1 hypothetical protein BA766_00355 [Stenotrophomonas maltophilia]
MAIPVHSTMAIPVDQVVFLLAADCFREALFPTFPESDVEAARLAAQRMLDETLNGGDNYYLCASFSEARIGSTHDALFDDLRSRGASVRLQNHVGLLIQALPAPKGAMLRACDTITSIASYLFWLESDALCNPVTTELVDAIAVIEPLGLQREPPCVDWHAAWTHSESEQDRYIASLMDGIDDAPVYMFNDVQAFTIRFDFLSLWRAQLGETRFEPIRKFIAAEAHLRLDDRDGDAAGHIDQILAAI